MKNILTKKCIVCGKEFIKKINESKKDWKYRHKFCSRECSNGQKKGKHFSSNTEFSKQRHFVPKTAIKKGQRLSVKTEFKKGLIPWNKGKKMSSELYEKLKKKGFFKSKFGKKSGNWKGGITKLAAHIRTIREYKEWRTAVFIRDNHTCQKCGARRKKGDRVVIQAHHKKAFYKILEEKNIKTIQQAKECKELWRISNGETLCVPCHKQTDSYLINQHSL